MPQVLPFFSEMKCPGCGCVTALDDEFVEMSEYVRLFVCVNVVCGKMIEIRTPVITEVK